MRHVFPTEQVIHLWAHQSQSDARNPSGNVYFRDSTIYSYRESWPMGKIFKKKATILVLTNSEKYSVTTAKHQSWVNSAVRHMDHVAVPIVSPESGGMSKPQVYHAANIKYLQDAAAEHLAKARRAMQARTVEWHHNAARERHDEITRYMAFFGIRRKVAPFPAAAWASSALARATSIETPDPVRDAKRYKAQQARAKATAAHFAEKREAWRSGAGDTLADMTRSERQQWRSMPCMLRVQGDEIVTSQGARIPVAHAPRLWARIQRAVIGEPYTANGRSEHAGQFKVDSINTAGTLRAGCHTIKYDELALLARTLNLEVAA